jgi:uncharacterized membrane protein
MTVLVIGLSVFIGVHSISIVAPAFRERMVTRLGGGPWRGVYSLFAALGLVLTIWGYGLARGQTAVLYVPPLGLRHAGVALMVFVFPLLLAAYLPGRIRDTLKHPMLVAVKTWALAHLLANGSLADVVLFGSLLVWAVADRISVKRRARASEAPVLPVKPWNDAIAIAAGLAIYVAFIAGGHAWLIGVPIMVG